MAFSASGLINAFRGLGNKVRRPNMSPTADRLLSDVRKAPISVGEYDPDMVSPELRDLQPTIPLNSRPTPAPPSEYERLVGVGRQLSADPTLDENGKTIRRPGRFKSGLMQLANAVGEAARTNVAAGRTDWSDLAGVAGAGAVGMGVGVADPGLIVKARHEQALARNQKAQDRELGRVTGLAKVKGIEAEAARDQAYAAANTPEGMKAKADAKKAIDEAKNMTEALKELDDIAQKGADSDYLQARASEIETRFGKKVLVPKYNPKAEGGFSLPPGGIRYDSQGNPIVQNSNPTAGQVEAVTRNVDDIGRAEAEKRQMESLIATAKDRATNEEKNVQTLEANKPKWDQKSADNEDTGADYVKKYNKDLEQWQKRRDKAQTDLETAVKAQKDAESKYSGSYVPQQRSLPTPPNVTPHTFSLADIQKRAKAAGQSVEAYKARVLELYPNAKFK
jgi:hypothetical protein